MKRIEKILLCGKLKDGTEFLYIDDTVNAYVYRAWNPKTGIVKIPEKIKNDAGMELRIKLIGWNSVASTSAIKNYHDIELSENNQLT